MAVPRALRPAMGVHIGFTAGNQRNDCCNEEKCEKVFHDMCQV